VTVKHWKDVTKDEWPLVYFKPQEIACRGTGLVLLTPASLDALRRLDDLRRAMGHPLLVNSGYRSPQHNKAVGGAKASKHMEGIAFDVSMANVDPHAFEAAAKKAGFRGIGLYPPQKPTGARNFIHIDTRATPWRGTQWGEFPRRPTRFAPELPPAPVREAMADTGPVIAGGAAVEAALATAEPALRELAPWLPDHIAGYAMAGAVGIGLGLALWRIFTRRNRGEG
jgi:zinc D-Ala-D-Ala carboxypeptidase